MPEPVRFRRNNHAANAVTALTSLALTAASQHCLLQPSAPCQRYVRVLIDGLY